MQYNHTTSGIRTEEEQEQQLRAHNMLFVLLLASGLFLFGLMIYSHFPAASIAAGTMNDTTTPVPTITNLLEETHPNRSVYIGATQLHIQTVAEAKTFSDDTQHTGTYTVRVYLFLSNQSNLPYGIAYNTSVELKIQGNLTVAPTSTTMMPVILPHQTNAGYIDFPLSQSFPLSTLQLEVTGKYLPLGS